MGFRSIGFPGADQCVRHGLIRWSVRNGRNGCARVDDRGLADSAFAGDTQHGEHGRIVGDDECACIFCERVRDRLLPTVGHVDEVGETSQHRHG